MYFFALLLLLEFFGQAAPVADDTPTSYTPGQGRGRRRRIIAADV